MAEEVRTMLCKPEDPGLDSWNKWDERMHSTKVSSDFHRQVNNK